MRRMAGRPWAFISVDGHGALRYGRHFAMRLDAPALGHAVPAGGQAEESRQLDDFRVAVKFLELRVDFLVSPVIKRERARVVQGGASLRVGMLPGRQSAAHLLLFGDGGGQRRSLPRAEFAAHDLGDLDARELLDLVRHGAAAVQHVPVARKLLGHFRVLAHRPVPRRRRTFGYFGALDHIAQSWIGGIVVYLRNIRHMRQSGHPGPPNSLDMSRFRSVAAPSAIFAIVQDGLIKAVRTIALSLYYHHSRSPLWKNIEANNLSESNVALRPPLKKCFLIG